MRKATKIVISFAVILIAGLNLIVPAFAQDPFSAIAVGGLTGASGAGLFGSMAGMSGVNIEWSQNGSDPMDAMWNVLNPDHVYFSGEKHEADTQSDPEDIYDYIIVDIGDWLDAQSDFITEFITQNSVQDNDSGSTIVSYSFEGIPFNNNGLSDVMASVTIDTSVLGTYTLSSGNYSVEIVISQPTCFFRYYYKGNLVNEQSERKIYVYDGIYGLCLRLYNTDVQIGLMRGANLSRSSKSIGTVDSPETVNYTSGAVDAHVFDGWENAKVKIPHSISGLSPNWDIPEFLGAINQLWDRSQQGQIVIEDTDQPVPPPPVPVPSTPLGEVPFDDWVDLWGQGIYEQLENQSDALDFIGAAGEDAVEELESIDTSIQDLGETAESIDTNIGIGNGILGGIRSLAQSAVNYLEGIAEHVEELVEEIVEGTETLIAGILNQIPQAFSVIFGPIKQASSIWHYVVEWIISIGAPFQFIWSMASGTSYYVILPVYASLAAAVVLAFFKRFGR